MIVGSLQDAQTLRGLAITRANELVASLPGRCTAGAVRCSVDQTPHIEICTMYAAF
jgi:hypothetical protein